MIRSMTGFSFQRFCLDEISYLIEIKSYNFKGREFQIRLPENWQELEPQIRELLSGFIGRGKLYLNIKEEKAGGSRPVLDTQFINNTAQQFEMIMKDSKIRLDPSFLLLRSEAFVTSSADLTDEKHRTAVIDHLEKALKEFDAFRQREGKQHETDMIRGLENITEKLSGIEKLIPELKEAIRAKIGEKITLCGDDAALRERMYQELSMMMERQDFNEEIVRFKEHLSFFRVSMNEDMPGKKLTFISQEMLREINTLSVKCGDSRVSSLAVTVKDEIEKIREQLLNIE